MIESKGFLGGKKIRKCNLQTTKQTNKPKKKEKEK